MAALTDTAYIIRKGIIIVIIGIILTVIGVVVAKMIIANYKRDNPPQPAKPTVAFGKLPPMPLPQNNTYPTQFQLLTIEGRPPEGSTSAKVYFVPKKSPTLFSRKNAQEFAKKLGFTQEPNTLDPITHQYIDPTTQSTLTIDITNSNFTLKNNYLDVAVFTENAISLTEQQLVALARNYFSTLNLWDNQLTESKVAYFRFEGQTLVPAVKPKEAQVIRVDFFKKEIDQTPLVTVHYDTSAIYLIFSTVGGKIGQTLEASFTNFPPDTTNYSTYPVISGNTAWEQLKGGNAHIARPVAASPTAIIRTIYFAYLVNTVYMPYVQPVWVFEGDFDFVGIVPAIDPIWIGQ